MSILVTGGCGYIGSHMTWNLHDAGKDVVIIDNLSTGYSWLVPDSVPVIEGDIGDADLVAKVMKDHTVEAVIHFAGSIVVPESVTDPLGYYLNNTVKSRSLIENAVKAGVKAFIFSSTAAVYGNPAEADKPLTEDLGLEPISPYGTSKLMTELMLRDSAVAYGLKYAALRYFNVAGADPQGRTGQSTPTATHLIKVANQVALGQRESLSIFGDDYPTPDGTCIRDYIHVSDLVAAHALALEALLDGHEPFVANCGYGKGYFSILMSRSRSNRDQTVLYFPGCGASLFSRSIGMASVYLLLKSGVNVVLPDHHMCCGYPLLASGCEEAYKTNRHRNVQEFLDLLVKTGKAGLKATTLLTACGTCRESLETYDFSSELADPLKHLDVVQFLMERLPAVRQTEAVLYHSACHMEWTGVPKLKAPEMYRAALSRITGTNVDLSPGCCGESGMGAMTSPAIYNRLRERKQEQLREDLGLDRSRPIVVGCPSCKIGIKRSMLQMKRPNRVLHAVEYLAECVGGPKWEKELVKLLETVERKGA